MHTGTFTVDGRMKEGPGGVGAGSLVLPNGDRVVLGERTAQRSAACPSATS